MKKSGKPKKPKNPESEIQKAIMQWMEGAGIFCQRMPLGPIVKFGRMTKNHLKGFPDLFGIIPNSGGRLFVIEVKAQDGKVSPDQVRWINMLLANDVTVQIARSLREVIENFTRPQGPISMGKELYGSET